MVLLKHRLLFIYKELTRARAMLSMTMGNKSGDTGVGEEQGLGRGSVGMGLACTQSWVPSLAWFETQPVIPVCRRI